MSNVGPFVPRKIRRKIYNSRLEGVQNFIYINEQDCFKISHNLISLRTNHKYIYNVSQLKHWSSLEMPCHLFECEMNFSMLFQFSFEHILGF